MNTSMHRCHLIVLGIFACITLSFTVHAATTAGRVVFALGQPKATDTAGAERTLARGDEVYEGDSLATAARERLQLSMIDGAFISVQPASTYAIQEYVYNGKPDGSEKATYQLVKGGVRALTGLIGKSKPGAYKVNTAVATIGIRGTGHNTRICQGDCGTLPNGLYHNTWEGITYVMNNVDSKDVPTGRGVYVKDLNTMIEFQEQVPGVTAAVVASASEAAATEKEDTEPVYQQGETQQVSSTVSMLPDFLMALSGGSDPTFPDITGDFGYNDVYGFFNSGGQLIGALLTEPVSTTTSSSSYFEIRTIDLAAMQSGSDPVATQLVNDALAASASDSSLASNIDLLNSNPASVVEFSTDATLGVGWGRWANGHVLTLYYDSESASYSQLYDLTNNQSVHFIYGPEPPATLPTIGMASYDFFGGTHSTSLSGATIGNGVTSGTISFDFATSFGTLDMDVNHNSMQYAVNADLYAYDINFVYGGGDAYTSASTSYCVDGCGVYIIGSFAGDTSGNPQFINFHYQVDEADPFIGVASFKFGSLVVPSSIVSFYDGIIGVSADDPTLPTDVGPDSGGNTVSAFYNASNQIIGVMLTSSDITPRRELYTINLDAMLGGNDATAVAEVQSLYNNASNASSAASAVAANPASVGEFFYDAAKGVGWGRWTNGNVLEIQGTSAAAVNLSGTQSLHFMFADVTTDISGFSSTATYNFLGGTQATSTNGADPAGSGVTSGSILVNFGLSDADITMTVNHGIDYSVSGILYADPIDSSIYDAVHGDVTASSSSSTCNPCDVYINGGFAGLASGGVAPQFVGIKYEIQEPNIVMGVAGFEYSGP